MEPPRQRKHVVFHTTSTAGANSPRARLGDLDGSSFSAFGYAAALLTEAALEARMRVGNIPSDIVTSIVKHPPSVMLVFTNTQAEEFLHETCQACESQVSANVENVNDIVKQMFSEFEVTSSLIAQCKKRAQNNKWIPVSRVVASYHLVGMINIKDVFMYLDIQDSPPDYNLTHLLCGACAETGHYELALELANYVSIKGINASQDMCRMMTVAFIQQMRREGDWRRRCVLLTSLLE